MALLLSANALHKGAEILERDSLAMDEKHFGKDSTEVAVRSNNLATTLHDTKRLAEAEPLARRWRFSKRVWGDQHPNTIKACEVHASIMSEMEDQ